MSNRRKWALFIGLVGAGGLLTALGSLAADLPAVAIPLGVVGGVLAAVGGALSLHPGERAAAEDPAPRRPRVVFGAIPQVARWFQERPDEQDALVKSLGDNGFNRRAALVALPGARGAGKSQLAAAHARRCDEDGFDVVAWINAERGPVAELALLAKELGVPVEAGQPPEQAAQAAIRAVSGDDGRRRLIVFDNVDDPDSVRPYLPVSGTVKVIVTTNRQEFKTMAGVTAVEVGMFTPAQGAAFLASATGLSDGDGAATVGARLGWLPLGLAQAAAYIRLNNLTYRQYLTKLGTLPLDETLQRQAGAQHPGILAATRLAVDSVNSSDPTGNAARLLTVLTCLAAEGITRDLLIAPHALQALDLDDTTMTQALRVLASASLVTLAGPADAVAVLVHRLTGIIVRHLAGDLSAALGSAAKLLAALIDELPIYQAALRRREMDELVAHIQALYDHYPRPGKPVFGLRIWAADALREAGDYGNAIAMHRQSLADCDHRFGPDDILTLTIRDELASAFQSAGRPEDAIALQEQIVADRERVQGTDHQDTLTSRNNLAINYRRAGRLDEAIALHRQTLADRQRILGDDHVDTFNSRNNLASAYCSVGRLDEAIALDEQNLADRQRIFGNDHPDTFTSRNNLANDYQQAGRYDEAVALHEQNLADCRRVLGNDHPDTLNTLYNLANAYVSADRLDEAIALLERNLPDSERILGPDHPDTVSNRQTLGDLYLEAGRHKDADRLLSERDRG